MLAKTWIWVVVVVVVAAGCGGAGYVIGSKYPAVSAAKAENDTLGILGAGTLKPMFPRLAKILVNETSGISAPSTTQVYEGSIDIVNAISTAPFQKTDVAAFADFRLVPHLLEPTYANYEVAFAQTPEVLVYNPTIPQFDGINSTNWGWKLVKAVAASGLPLGVWNASTDPNGYNEIFSMELQGAEYNGTNTSIFSTFYQGEPWDLAKPVTNQNVAVYEHESQAANLVNTSKVAAVITYRSYAVANHLTYVSFNSLVGLDNSSSTALATYAKLSTEILTASSTLARAYAAPVIFAVTVPIDAPNPTLGLEFLHLLLSPQGGSVLTQGGAFTPIFPGWYIPAAGGPAPPSLIAPDVVAPPSWATALVT